MQDTKAYYVSDSLLTEDEVLGIEPLIPEKKEFSFGIAYLDDDYYYKYRGNANVAEINDKGKLTPGIYKDSKTSEIVIIPPTTEEDKEKYRYENKIVSANPKKIIDTINNKEQLLISIPESSKVFLPVLTTEDDILKRLIKQALIEKNIDIDRYRQRFIDKNAVFNFCSCLRSNNRLSMMLFDRGCEAFNLKYTITIEEVDPDNYIGDKIDHPITASSEDTYKI